jgi:phosphonoacetaldehyde hydrolase
MAVVFDWAGTMIDHGSRAPMGVFVKVFKSFGVEISVEEARGPMGMAKRDHIARLIYSPRIAAAWAAAQGHEPTEADVDRVYELFVPMNREIVTDFAELIDGAADAARRIRARGLKIGSTTGYTRDIMERLLPKAAEQGYAPDNLVCAGELPEGRPAPLMMFRTFLDLDVWPAWRVAKVDDTEVGIEEGLNAGCWTVGVAMTGNVFGLSPDETARLSFEARERMRADAYARLTRSGAHFVVDSVADLDEVLDEIEGALARGERP